MPRNPVQKTYDNPRFLGGVDILYNNIIPYDIPRYTDGNLWRYVAQKQPVIQACIVSLVFYAQGLPWDIRAKAAKDNKKRKDEIEEYKNIFQDSGGVGRLHYLDHLIQDFSTIPFGAAAEAVKYSDGRLYKIINIDGATLYPTNNPAMPVMQRVGVHDPVFYKPDEINRMYQSPRTEISRAGWGMAPIEKMYLAIELLSRGDKYYAGLLLDTPEAGILDLGDMSQESALKWLESFKNLVSGVDAFKIPVLYQHTVPAKFIPFGRPPTELMFDAITFKYAELACAAFGLSIGDIGLKHPGGGSQLSAQMRDERHSRVTGYAALKAHITEHYNKYLPDYLEFVFIDTDDEILVAKGRARSANAVGMRNLVEAGIITPKESRDQLVADGLLTIPMEDDVNEKDFEILNQINGLDDQIDIQQQQVDIQKEQLDLQQNQPKPTSSPLGQNKIGGQGGQGINNQRNLRGGKLQNIQGKEPVPASQGGQGEIKSDILEIIEKSYHVPQNLSILRARRLVKAALKRNFSMIRSSAGRDDFEEWRTGYIQRLFNKSTSDIEQKMVEDQIEDLSKFLDTDKWWETKLEKQDIQKSLANYYTDGLKQAAEKIQINLYEDGRTNVFEVNGDFELKNPDILKQLSDRADIMENFINEGSKYYLTRLSLGSILEVIPEYLEITLSSTADQILDADDFINAAANVLINTISQVFKITSMVDNMIETTISDGFSRQYEENKVVKSDTTDFEYYRGN